MHSLKFTLFLLIILISPLVLRKISMEPYPAILLPDGSGVVEIINKEVVFEFEEIYALNKKGQWVKVDPTVLFKPLPDAYTASIIKNLRTSGKSALERGGKKNKILKLLRVTKKTEVTKEDINQRNLWLKNRLAGLGLNNTKISICTAKIYSSPQTGKLIHKETDDRKIILLD